MAAMSGMAVTIKEEPIENSVQGEQNNGKENEPTGLDYNAIFGNLYRDFMAHNVSSESEAMNTTTNPTTTTAATAEDNSKVAIPPECYAESFDIQDVVNEFKVTLEKFGVSQRFAAKYIMEDTSQGNLSFLMDKGKRLKWAELSPKGRIPYVRMKQWLDSREKQMDTIEMVKENKAMTRQNSNRDAFQRRERFSLFQLTVLCRLFEENSNPSMSTRQAIADKLSIPPERINVWFQNQRARGFPAKRILQQSFHAANATNGAAKSASIMNSVAMEIVNQSKTDSLLASNSALVSQYVENSLLKTDSNDSDAHRLLLQYSMQPDQLNALDSQLNRTRGSSPVTSSKGAKRSRSGSQKSSNSDENTIALKVKTEPGITASLNDMDRELTSNEKVNGYLSHLNQNQSKPKNAYGSQLDSVVKRISQTHQGPGTLSHSKGSNHTQSGAAKRKPAFLNKVLAEPKGDATIFDGYPSPYCTSPVTTSTDMLYDSSPLSALYRQTASVNFTPPNHSFNYLFDIGSPAHLPPVQPNFYSKLQDMSRGTYSEPRKRLHDEATGDFGLDFKRKRTSNSPLGSGNQDETKRDSPDIDDVNGETDTMKVPVQLSNKSVKILNIPKPETQNKDSESINDSANEKESEIDVLNGDLQEESKNPDKTENDKIETLPDSKLNEGEVKQKNTKAVTEKSANESKRAVIENKVDADDELSVNSGHDEEYSVNQSADCKDVLKCDMTNQNNSKDESDKSCSNDSDTDKPLSKEEMELFKSLYARFVKYHFAQMQFPDIK